MGDKLVSFNEQKLFVQVKKKHISDFINMIEAYDNDVADSMLTKGYRRMNRSYRTVLFTFGEVRFARTRWYKDGKCYVPVDEYLNLEKYNRISPDLCALIVQLASYVSYRKVAEILELQYGLNITKDTVLKVCKQVKQQNSQKTSAK